MILRQVNNAGLRQAATPLAEMGRVQATALLVRGSARPAGALLGGLVATLIGIPLTLVFAEIGMLLSVLPLIWAPVRTIATLAHVGELENA